MTSARYTLAIIMAMLAVTSAQVTSNASFDCSDAACLKDLQECAPEIQKVASKAVSCATITNGECTDDCKSYLSALYESDACEGYRKRFFQGQDLGAYDEWCGTSYAGGDSAPPADDGDGDAADAPAPPPESSSVSLTAMMAAVIAMIACIAV